MSTEKSLRKRGLSLFAMGAMGAMGAITFATFTAIALATVAAPTTTHLLF